MDIVGRITITDLELEKIRLAFKFYCINRGINLDSYAFSYSQIYILEYIIEEYDIGNSLLKDIANPALNSNQMLSETKLELGRNNDR